MTSDLNNAGAGAGHRLHQLKRGPLGVGEVWRVPPGRQRVDPVLGPTEDRSSRAWRTSVYVLPMICVARDTGSGMLLPWTS
jgi:hypothetical protein